jgi:DNA-binding CsgD family transcriptional regulator
MKTGRYSSNFITDIAFDPNDSDNLNISDRIIKFPVEGIYIYSFEKGKMLYADGWKDVVGYDNNEISMVRIVQLTAPQFKQFVNEVNDKALMFLHHRDEQLLEYFFKIEIKMLHKNGTEIPVIATVRVHDTFENGKLKSIMGRFQVDYGLRFGKIMRYSAFGPDKEVFEHSLNEKMLYQLRISEKEIAVIKLIASGLAYKEIAAKLDITHSAVEKRIRPLFKRFEVKNIAHLVSFAYENYLLP